MMTRKPLGAVRIATLAIANAVVLAVVAVSVAADPGDLIDPEGGKECFNNHCAEKKRLQHCMACCTLHCSNSGALDCIACCKGDLNCDPIN